jgi:hypothetical protein
MPDDTQVSSIADRVQRSETSGPAAADFKDGTCQRVWLDGLGPDHRKVGPSITEEGPEMTASGPSSVMCGIDKSCLG